MPCRGPSVKTTGHRLGPSYPKVSDRHSDTVTPSGFHCRCADPGGLAVLRGTLGAAVNPGSDTRGQRDWRVSAWLRWPPVFLTVALRAPPPGRGLATLRGADEALAELAAYFRRWCEPPDAELVRLAAAARAAGSRWEAIAAACDARDDPDPAAVMYRPFGLIPGQGAGPLFRVTQHAVHELTGSDGGYYTCR